MRGSAKTPSRWRAGAPLKASKLDEPGAALRELLRGVASPRQVNPAGAATAPEVRRFKISAILKDYLQCVSWDGTVEGPTTFVAKPFLLRASATSRAFSGGTLEFSAVSETGSQRTATLDAVSETQIIVPEYVIGDEITAVRNVKGTTGVTRPEAGDEKTVDWLDMNIDGRAWAKEA